MFPVSECASAARLQAGAAARACAARGLVRSAQWLAELAYSVRGRPERPEPPPPAEPDDQEDEEGVLVARTLLEAREYERAAFFANKGKGRIARFLHLYARYLADQSRTLDSLSEAGATGSVKGSDGSRGRGLRQLYENLRDLHASGEADGYVLYLFGVVLAKLELRAQAAIALQEAIAREPWLWAAWLELASLPRDRDALEALRLPEHCLSHFFLGHAHLERKSVEEAIDAYEALKANGFDQFTYLNAQLAVAYHDLRGDFSDANILLRRILWARFVFRCRKRDRRIQTHSESRPLSVGRPGHILAFVVRQRNENGIGKFGTQSSRNR